MTTRWTKVLICRQGWMYGVYLYDGDESLRALGSTDRQVAREWARALAEKQGGIPVADGYEIPA